MDLLVGPKIAPDEGQLGLFLGFASIGTAVAGWLWSITSPLEAPTEDDDQPHVGGPSRFRTRRTERLTFIGLNSAAGFAAIGLTLGLFFPSLAPLLISTQAGLVRTAHIVGALLIIYLCVLAIVLAFKNQAKATKLGSLDKTLARVNASRGLPVHADPKPLGDTRSQQLIDAALGDLLESLDQAARIPELVGGPHPLRTAWLYLPDSDGRSLRAVHVRGWSAEYREVAIKHRPAMLTQAKVDTLHDMCRAKRNSLQTHAYKEWYAKSYLPELWSSSSLTGWAFTISGAFAYGNIGDCPFFDASYLELIASDDRNRCTFRSCAGVRLELGSKPFGVLMLFDTVREAFGEKDALPIRIYGALLSDLVGDAIAEGLYTPTEPVFCA